MYEHMWNICMIVYMICGIVFQMYDLSILWYHFSDV